ncbi:MAG: hypothetical protein H0W70_11735 [Actinobacteria bacterium]|nr:hypothetical protein [Actinomycetota bacterium]
MTVLLVLSACSGSGVIKIKDPGPVPDLTTTTAIDFSAIGLKGVSSRTTTSVPLGPGGATLRGTVTGPDGAVEGATVHVERLVGPTAGAADVATAADGTWTLPAILGGRYRVRTWKAPELALTKPEIFFLEARETKKLDLRVDRYSGGSVTASIAPDPPVVGQPANLFVLVSARTVDLGGVVRGTPAAGVTVDLSGTGFQLESPNPTTTDSNGVAQWRVRCTTVGATSLSVTVTGTSFPVTVPACADSSAGPSEPPTTADATTTTSRPTRGSTSTTRR